MKGLEFPVFKTKKGSSRKFNLYDPQERQKYFQHKAGKEIAELKEYLKTNTFIAYLLGKKQAGKGTYTKLLAEALDMPSIKHLSIGDLVRSYDIVHSDENAKKELLEYLKNNYRGYISAEEAFDAFLHRGTDRLIPTEFILTLVKREIEKSGHVNLCIDGFPRNLDQVSYSLYFRELIDYRSDPDIFVLIDVPEAVIDERIKYRRVCPQCGLSRSISLNPTSIVKYDTKKDEYYLVCDNKECTHVRLEPKEGDEKGIDHIRARLDTDDELIRKAFTLHGVPKILLRSSIPVSIIDEVVDPYEITPRVKFSCDMKTKKVHSTYEPWTYLDDNGVESQTLVPAPVVLAFIRGLHEILIEGKMEPTEGFMKV